MGSIIRIGVTMSILIKIGLIIPLLLVIITPSQSRGRWGFSFSRSLNVRPKWQTCTCKVPQGARAQSRSRGGTAWRECVCQSKPFSRSPRRRAFRTPRVVDPDKLESIGSYNIEQDYEQDWDDEALVGDMKGGRRDFLSWLICGIGFCPMNNGK